MLGAVGIFLYVGVEVGLASIAVNYFKTQGVDSAKTASFLVSLLLVRRAGRAPAGSWILTKIQSGKLLGVFGFAAALRWSVSMVSQRPGGNLGYRDLRILQLRSCSRTSLRWGSRAWDR